MMLRMSGAFSVVYDGPAMEEHRMDVRDLAPALLGFAEAVDRARELTPGAPALRLEIQATRGASFDIDFVLNSVDAAHSTAVNLFTSDTAAAMAAFSAIRDLVVGTVLGAVAIAKRARSNGGDPTIDDIPGEPAPEGLPEQPAVRLTWHTGDQLEISKAAWETYCDPGAMRGLAKAAGPLSEGAIDSLQISSATQEVILTPDDKPALTRAEAGVEVNSFEAQTVVWPQDITFRENGKWRVTDGQSHFFARVEDEAFRARMDAGTERFGKRDSFLVLLRTTQREVDGRPEVEKTIVEVLEHREGGQQLELDFRSAPSAD